MKIKVGDKFVYKDTNEVIEIIEVHENIGAASYIDHKGERCCLSTYGINMLFEPYESKGFVNQYDQDIRNFFKKPKHNKVWAIRREK